jgi:hypothetical protein
LVFFVKTFGTDDCIAKHCLRIVSPPTMVGNITNQGVFILQAPESPFLANVIDDSVRVLPAIFEIEEIRSTRLDIYLAMAAMSPSQSNTVSE